MANGLRPAIASGALMGGSRNQKRPPVKRPIARADQNDAVEEQPQQEQEQEQSEEKNPPAANDASKDTIDQSGKITMSMDAFGPIRGFVEDKEITDIDYNGTDLWVRDCYGKRYKVTDPKVMDRMDWTFIQRLTKRIQNSVSKEFNPQHPLLEAETKTLRISIVHEHVCNGRRSVCIRKVLPEARINTRYAIESEYASAELLSFLNNAVRAHFNITICGEPGTGKTEFAKYISLQIPENERVITIEDSLEWHYHDIKPKADCVEMQIFPPQFDYYMAIKACLRQNPRWIMISEVRGKEVANYIQQLTTGVNGITTLHTDDVSHVPDRLCNMGADVSSRERLLGDIYSFCDLAVLVDMITDTEGVRHRLVSQVGLFYTDEETNEGKMILIFDKGQNKTKDLPQPILDRFKRAHIEDPFYSDQTMKEAEGAVWGAANKKKEEEEKKKKELQERRKAAKERHSSQQGQRPPHTRPQGPQGQRPPGQRPPGSRPPQGNAQNRLPNGPPPKPRPKLSKL